MLLFSGLKTCTPTHIRRHFACTHKNHLVTHLHRWEKHALKYTWTNLHAIDKEEREHFWNGRYSHYYLSLLSVAAATLKTRSKLEMQKLTLSPSGQAGLKHENEFLKIIYSNKNPGNSFRAPLPQVPKCSRFTAQQLVLVVIICKVVCISKYVSTKMSPVHSWRTGTFGSGGILQPFVCRASKGEDERNIQCSSALEIKECFFEACWFKKSEKNEVGL